jgi:hypothetical protein
VNQGNEPSRSIKDGEFLDHLSNYYLFKENCSLVVIVLLNVGIYM